MTDLTREASTRAAILAIGTELTTGQITNRNAAWLSEKLTDLGADVVLHETVADDRAAILEALERCRKAADLLFVTGGLGPTTDDFTREVIAQWAEQPLEFYEPSWTKIQNRLNQLGIPIAQSNRQQCDFPKGAKVIENTDGTADAFYTRAHDAHVWVLPGPPREVASVWQGGIEKQLKEILPIRPPLKLLTWQCIGKSEAELGELTENALQGSGLAIGYRAHMPYVEIKVWCPEPELSAKKPYLDRLEAVIGQWVITRQGVDLGRRLLDGLSRSEEIEIIDAASGGLLCTRIGSLLRDKAYADRASTFTLITEWAGLESPKEWVHHILAHADDEITTLVLGGFTDQGEWAIGFKEGITTRTETMTSPWLRKELIDRTRAMATELALKKWSDWLNESTH